MHNLKYFSGFSGIGGFDLGIDRIIPNAVNIGFSEVDKYAIKIYERHFPNRTNYGDITKIEAESLPDFDIFCGGFPCQDVSIAGKRKGLCGARSGLFFEIIRIIREKQPRIVFLENVKGLLSSNEGWDFARILIELEGVGYDVEWACLNSKNFGVPQNRERVFIVGHSRRESWKPVFPIQEANGVYFETTANCLDANYHKGYLNHGQRTMIQIGTVGDSQAQRVYSTDGPAKTLSAGGGQGAKTGLYLMGHSRDNKGTATYHNVGAVGALKQPSGNQQNLMIYNMQPRCGNPKIGGTGHLTRNYGVTYCLDSTPQAVEIVPTIRAEHHNTTDVYFINQESRIRRLTPLEAERLQGFPDGWTALGSDNKPISDTQRYKCLGNAVTVNVIECIANSILASFVQ